MFFLVTPNLILAKLTQYLLSIQFTGWNISIIFVLFDEKELAKNRTAQLKPDYSIVSGWVIWGSGTLEGHAVSGTWKKKKKKSNNMYLLPLFPLETGIGGGLVELQRSVQPN